VKFVCTICGSEYHEGMTHSCGGSVPLSNIPLPPVSLVGICVHGIHLNQPCRDCKYQFPKGGFRIVVGTQL
jgi:hypothetical protein